MSAENSGVYLAHGAPHGYGFEVEVPLHGHSLRLGSTRLGIRLAVEVDEDEVHVGSHQMGLSDQLADVVRAAFGHLLALVDDGIGIEDVGVVFVPGKLAGTCLGVEVVPDLNLPVGVERSAARGVHLRDVGAQLGHRLVHQLGVVHRGEQGAVLGQRVGDHFSYGLDVEVAVARGHHQASCHQHACHQLSYFSSIFHFLHFLFLP